jgi:HK97 gp10 family phage protein
MASRVYISGLKEFDAVLRELPEQVKKRVMSTAVRSGGTVIKNEMKRRAPYNARRRKGHHLREAIMVRKHPGTRDIYRVGANYTMRGPSAPHAHLVELGTKPRKLKKPRRIYLGGKWRLVTHTGRMPASHFMRKSVEASAQQAGRKMAEILSRGIERTALQLAGKYRALPKYIKKALAR